MTQSALKTLSRDLHALADEATDHLKDAAQKTGAEAAEAVARSTKAITQAADRLRDAAGASAVSAREQVSATVRAYPLTTGVVAGVIGALAATFALVRLSQS